MHHTNLVEQVCRGVGDAEALGEPVGLDVLLCGDEDGQVGHLR